MNLEVTFVVEKKKAEKSLVDRAAEAVAEMVEEDVENVEHLEIPVTLKKTVMNKIRDFRWTGRFQCLTLQTLVNPFLNLQKFVN